MRQLKRWAIWGGAALVVLCVIGLANRPKDRDATPTPETAAQATSTPSPLIETTATLMNTATPAVTATPAPPPATQTPKERYITIAQGSALPLVRDRDMSDGEWEASVINAGDGPELELRVPLSMALSNEQFVRQARRNIALIVNALFVAEPDLFRITVIGTFPDQGPELPAVSLFVYRSKSNDWGTVTADQLDGLAEWVDIKPRFR